MNTASHTSSAPDALRNLSAQDFKNLGNNFIAYIRPVHIESGDAFGLYSADGRLLALQETGDGAYILAKSNGLEPVVVH